MSSEFRIGRRDFIRVAGIGVAASAFCGRSGADILPGAASAVSNKVIRKGKLITPDRKLNIACIGCGGKGAEDVSSVSSENIVALCDVDSKRADAIFKRFPDVPKFKDYRKMLVEMDDKIDAVTVTTPDHTHFPAAMMAMQMGKHVYVQKPLTHTVWEARTLTETAKEHEVVTQMGNQGHAYEGCRLLKEWLQAGAIGNVHEVHIWTNRPIWPQGIKRPLEVEQVPSTLDWNLWLGVAPERPYNSCYLPFKWRGWWDFGCGALGDMGCHMMDASFWALDLKYPVSVEAKSDGNNEETAPESSIVTYKFPARGSMPPVTVKWYDGGKLPPRPHDLGKESKLAAGGQYLVGDKGVMMGFGDYCDSVRLIPEAKMKSFKRPGKTIPRVPEGNPYMEWINACKGGPKPGSNFVDHSGPLTEMVSLGNLAIRTGKKIEWDSKLMRCKNLPEADKLVRLAHRVF